MLKKISLFFVVTILLLAGIMKIDANERGSQSKRGLRNVEQKAALENVELPETNETTKSIEIGKIITDKVLPVELGKYYFTVNDKVYEVNLTTKEIKAFAEELPEISGSFFMVGADGQIYEMTDSRIDGLADSDKLRSVKSAKKSKSKKKILKSVSNSSSAKSVKSSRDARSVAGEDLSIKPITKFSVVGNDRYVYEYDLINKTVNKKDEFEYEIEDGKIYIKTGEEFETVDIQKLKDSKIEKLKDSDNENESERAVKSRSARSVRRSQTGNRGERRVEQLSGQDSKISDTEIIECTESGLIKIILKAEYSALIKKNEKIEGRIITKKPLNIDKSKIYFVENGYIYEADLKNNCIGKFIDKQVLKTNKYWFTVKPDGNILAVKLTDLTNDELTDSTKKTVGDRGVKSKSSPNRRVRTAGDRSETEVDTGLKDIIESDLRLKQENYIMAGKDRILYLYDIEKNEIFKYSKHSEEIKENQVLIIDSENNKYFIDLEKGTIEISKIEKFEDSEQEGDRGIRSRRSPKSQRPKIVKFGKSMKKTAESTVRSKRGVRSVSLQTDEEDAFLLELLSEFMLELEPAIEKISAGKLAFASSTSGQNSIEKFVNDGDVKTRWSSIFFDNHWISIDLGDRKKITKVVLNWERACGLNYKIQVSDDNINWIDAANITDGKWEIREIPVDAYGRYVRMNGVKRATQWGFSIWEFDIYGSDIVDKVEVDLKMKNAVIKSITDLINELPEVSIVKTEDREKIFSVLKLIEASKKYGASEADISNLDKLVKLENQLERLAKKNIMPANIIALNMSNEIVKSDGKGNWNAIGSGYNFIAVGADGELWTLKSQEIYRYKSDNNFEKIGGALVNISIGKNIWMVYGTNSSGAVYWRHPTQNVWQKLGGTLKQLSVGSDKTLFGVQSNQTIWELSNNNWNKLNGELNYVSVGNKDNIWGLTKDGQIYQYASGNWKQIDGNMKFISANNGNTAYGLDANNNVFKWQNAKWQQLEGQFKMLDVKTDTEIVSHFSPEKEIESKNIPINLAIDAINALPEILSVKIEDKDKIEAAKKIVAEAKAKGAADSDITNLDKISKLEAQITALEKKAAEEAAAKLKAEQEAIAKAAAEEEKKNAIKSAIDAITAFPEVSAVKIEDKDKIEAAKKIVAEAKAKGAADADITNLEKITQLESKIGELEKIAAEAKDISIEKISVGKNASASSGTAKNAIDGNVNTLWAAGWFDNEWIAIDLGDRKKITKVALNWERCGSEYKIQVSDNNEIWKDAAHIKNGKTENKEITVDVLGRYVLLKAIKCPNGGSAVREFDIYGRDLTAAEKKSEAEAAEKAAAEELAKAALNLALNKSITAMSQNRSYPVKNIVDGDTNTYWLTDEGGKPNLTINFGVNTEMTTLKIKWHSRRLREG
nr:discoidin domain-containing protein [Candidatus Dependentiae bacterium]